MNDVISAIQLIRSQGVGPRTYYGLIKKFGNIDEALVYLGDKAYPLDKVKQEIEQAQKLGIKILLHSQPEYPEALANTYDAPPVLFYKGNLDLFKKTIIGIVGTRNCSAAGMAITRKICEQLGEQGYIIASGLARGIDSEAHKTTIKTGTIAVVAGGLDVIYPPENKKLYEQIAQSGLIIGENPAGTEPMARHFPQRNRIIAGISAGILVVEAAKKSGSMITADYALREGREVFAVPGSPLDMRSGGTNYLIKNGAVLVEDANDIIDNLGKGLAPQLLNLREEISDELIFESNESPPATDAEEDNILSKISHAPVSVDEIVQQTSLPVFYVSEKLLELELNGKIKRTIGNKVVLAA